MELKTLKDFDNSISAIEMSREDALDKPQLKAEAVKWVKHYCFQTDLELRLFKDFFNLTEEDLK